MRYLFALLGVVIVGILAGELLMQPSSEDRVVLVTIFAGITVFTAGVGITLRLVTARLRSLHRAVLLVAVATVGVSVVTVALSAGLMFTSPHDLRLVLVALGLGVGLGLVVAAAVARPLASDLGRLGETARRVGAGDLAARTRIERPDELGDAARALDAMVEALAAADEERRRGERARREFLAAISHDLRTPLGALRAAVEALGDGLVDDPHRYFRAMERDVEALGTLVDDLFMLARIEAGDMETDPMPVDLAELADEAAEALGPVADRRGVDIRIHSGGSVPVLGSSAELARAIRNILDNAIRHSPPSAHVDVRVQAVDGTGIVQIVDAGPGFSPELVGSALEPFTKADPARGSAGSGLGLAIAGGVAEAHGGSVLIEPGPGGRVTLRVPLSDASRRMVGRARGDVGHSEVERVVASRRSVLSEHPSRLPHKGKG
jgi:two-component system sensor histidine kinase BaeS